MRRDALVIGVGVAILTLQALSASLVRREPFLPSAPPLSLLPSHLEQWSQLGVTAIEPASLAVLKPDDFLARRYATPAEPGPVELFVAYYKTQIGSANAHDPKVCLPGAGWIPVESEVRQIPRADNRDVFSTNYYRIRKNGTEQVVFYWFQTPNGTYVSEQQLRLHRVWDAILYNRTDMALVRIIAPVRTASASPVDSGTIKFVQSVYESMVPYFPATGRAR